MTNERWSAAAKKDAPISFLHEHPTHSMIEDGRIIKRRLLDGSIQTGLLIANIGSDFQKQFIPDGMPLASGGSKSWEPDISECFPIALGVIDPRSEAAKNTQKLWMLCGRKHGKMADMVDITFFRNRIHPAHGRLQPCTWLRLV